MDHQHRSGPVMSASPSAALSTIGNQGWYRSLRAVLARQPLLFRWAQSVRFAALLGPTYQLNRRVLPLLRTTTPLEPRDDSSISADVAAEAPKLRTLGFTAGATIRPQALRAIRAWCVDSPVRVEQGDRGVPMPVPPRQLKPGKTNYHYDGFLESCPPVISVLTDPQLLLLLGSYLEAEPVLARALLYWSVPDDPPTTPAESPFHYDTHGARSAMMICYLSEVGPEHGAHAVIDGTHGRKSLKRLLSRYLPAADAVAEFGERVHQIQGPAGTIVIEDPTILHSHTRAQAPRLVLVATYVPHGRSR